VVCIERFCVSSDDQSNHPATVCVHITRCRCPSADAPNVCFSSMQPTAFGVRRDKAALFQWVRISPGYLLRPEAIGEVMEVTK
jgi:hypothetical protein